MRELWPWLALRGLEMYHGINPAMGWLSVALGLHRGCRSVVVQSLIPIAIGHLLSIAVVAGAILALGLLIDRGSLMLLAGSGLILWALYHFAYGSRHQAHIGMRAGFAGLPVPYCKSARRSCQRFRHACESGHPGRMLRRPPWIPACAGMTGFHNGGHPHTPIYAARR